MIENSQRLQIHLCRIREGCAVSGRGVPYEGGACRTKENSQGLQIHPCGTPKGGGRSEGGLQGERRAQEAAGGAGEALTGGRVRE
eukprot:139-Prymnesium_polylepis.2